MPRIQRICQYCHTAYLFWDCPSNRARHSGQYCSRSCRILAHQEAVPTVERVCQQCGVTFAFRLTPSNVRKGYGIYCSTGCQIAAKQREPMQFWASLARCDHEPCCPYCCWDAPGAPMKGGYKRCSFQGAFFLAHRLAWRLINGHAIPAGKVIRHLCHRRVCCNPWHLMLGTAHDNSADAIQAGRTLRGSRQHNSKVTERDIPVIFQMYARGLTQTAIAAQVGLKQPEISSILRRETWGHVAITLSDG